MQALNAFLNFIHHFNTSRCRSSLWHFICYKDTLFVFSWNEPGWFVSEQDEQPYKQTHHHDHYIARMLDPFTHSICITVGHSAEPIVKLIKKMIQEIFLGFFLRRFQQQHTQCRCE